MRLVRLGKTRQTVLSSHRKHLNKLWVLLLSDNQLTTLPDEIGELKELEMLLAGNWKSSNTGKNEKGCENTDSEEDFKPQGCSPRELSRIVIEMNSLTVLV